MGSNKTIAKNTILLYIRMLFIMAVGFYTSRVVLQQLGVHDYGIYNVVGGIVAMFGIISGSLSTAISRFLNFELGKPNSNRLNLIFSTAVMIQLVISLVIVLLAEAVGVWFLNEKMNIAPERMGAANWVFQCSLLTFVLNMISIPYNAVIIAHEKMSAFAYISVLEASLKLGVAFMLFVPLFDSLKFYAVLLAITALIIRFVYAIYCKKHFAEAKFRFKLDKILVKKMLSFSGWNFIGASAGILRDQGVNILLNLFFGAPVNAARAIAAQVNTQIYNFSANFMMAVNPQIIQSYSSGDRKRMTNLVFTSSKFSYFLLFLMSLPIIYEIPKLLGIWLTVVPDHSVIFVRLILILTMSEAISIPLQFANQASGKVKIYQIVVGGIQLLNFPVVYLFLKLGFPPQSIYIIAIIVSQIALGARLIILNRTMDLSIGRFITQVYLKIIYVSAISAILPTILYFYVDNGNWGNALLVMGVSLLSTLSVVYFIGLSSNERITISSKIRSKLNHNKKY